MNRKTLALLATLGATAIGANSASAQTPTRTPQPISIQSLFGQQAPQCIVKPGTTLVASVTTTPPDATRPYRTQSRTLANYDADPAVEAAIQAMPRDKYIMLTSDDAHATIVPKGLASARFLGTDSRYGGRGLINLDAMRQAKVDHTTFEGDAYFANAQGQLTCKQPFQLHVEFGARRTNPDYSAQIAAEAATRAAADKRIDATIDSLAKAGVTYDRAQDEALARERARSDSANTAQDAEIARVKQATATLAQGQQRSAPTPVAPRPAPRHVEHNETPTHTSRSANGYITVGPWVSYEQNKHEPLKSDGLPHTATTTTVGGYLNAGIPIGRHVQLYANGTAGSVSGTDKSDIENPRLGTKPEVLLDGSDRNLEGRLQLVIPKTPLGLGVIATQRNVPTDNNLLNNTSADRDVSQTRTGVGGYVMLGNPTWNIAGGALRAKAGEHATPGQDEGNTWFGEARHDGRMYGTSPLTLTLGYMHRDGTEGFSEKAAYGRFGLDVATKNRWSFTVNGELRRGNEITGTDATRTTGSLGVGVTYHPNKKK